MEYLLEMHHISKSFFGVNVLNDVTFKVRPGSVHALMGENGAGKSTLMKILGGIYAPDQGSGKIVLDENQLNLYNPKQALENGISMIHQELSPILHMKVCENIFLGREPLKFGCLDYRKLEWMAKELLESIDCNIDPSMDMYELKVADMQLVEIAKAISFDSKIIIMDEPTSALTDREVESLFKVIRGLKAQGKGIIYISHKMDEILQISDDITVLRDGQFIEHWKNDEVQISEIMSAMVGRKLDDIFPKRKADIGEPILVVQNLSRKDKFYDINFHVKRGEVLGIVGLMGAGRTEVMEAVFGITVFDSGKIVLNGKEVRFRHPREAIKKAIAFVTEDRKMQGLVLPLSVKFNITLLAQKRFSRLSVLNINKEKKIAKEMYDKLNVKSQSMELAINKLSGGNQQKVVIAKWLLTNPDVIIMDEPTRGIDVGAKSEIYELINDLCMQGKAVIMVSSELPEVLGMSDRIMVFSNKKVVGELTKDEFEQHRILELAMSNL